MRTVTVKLTINLVLNIDEGVEVQEIVNDMSYQFTSEDTRATVMDEEITDSEVIDSR